jgi:hypothetical protein
MTNKDIVQRLAGIDEILLKLIEEREKPSSLLKIWQWIKPYIIPFVLGMITGNFCQAPILFAPQPQTSIEQQAALGGAAIPPFSNWTQQSGSPSPGLATLPPENLMKESNDFSSMSTSALSLPVNRPADAGQTTLPRLLNPRTR